jgi:hypothetical protein
VDAKHRDFLGPLLVLLAGAAFEVVPPGSDSGLVARAESVGSTVAAQLRRSFSASSEREPGSAM